MKVWSGVWAYEACPSRTVDVREILFAYLSSLASTYSLTHFMTARLHLVALPLQPWQSCSCRSEQLKSTRHQCSLLASMHAWECLPASGLLSIALGCACGSLDYTDVVAIPMCICIHTDVQICFSWAAPAWCLLCFSCAVRLGQHPPCSPAAHHTASWELLSEATGLGHR